MIPCALSGRVIAEIIPNDTQTASGLYLPEAQRAKPGRAKVLSVGSTYINRTGKEFKPPCRVGDIIQYKPQSPRSLEVYGQAGLKKGKVVIWFEDIISVG
jgi:chaperonin GroES